MGVVVDKILDDILMHDHSESDLGAILDSRYLNTTSNLSDLNNVTTARTNLGLVAGGAGDIWVEKAGDTMNGALTITPSANGTSILNVTNQAGTSVLNVDTTNQRVGIGTTSPAGKIDVISSTYPVIRAERTTTQTGGAFGQTVTGIASGMLLKTTTSGDMTDGFGGGFLFGAGDNIVSSDTNYFARIYGRRDGADDTGAIEFYNGGDSKFSMIIRSSGNVGIGTTAPTAKLHVEGSALFNEAGANVDFRVESDTEPNMIFLDANADTDGALYLGGSTNGLKVSKGGDLIFQGTATVFQDVNTGFAGAKVPAANAPTWTTLIGNIKAYTFAVNDYVDVEALEVPHGWKEGSDIEIHIHWATNGNNDATVRGVKWEVEYTWANMLSAGGTTAFGSIAAVSTETSIAASEPTLTHKYTSVLTFTPTGGKVGMYVKLRLKRIASVTNTAPASNPFGLAVGIHCELDRVGSRTTGGS